LGYGALRDLKAVYRMGMRASTHRSTRFPVRRSEHAAKRPTPHKGLSTVLLLRVRRMIRMRWMVGVRRMGGMFLRRRMFVYRT
jgi:hypothetical protein